MTLQKQIRDLIFFYIKTNYNQYLKDNHISMIPDDKIESVIHSLYDERKEHLKTFIKNGLKKLYKDDYPGDLAVLNILMNIFDDDDLCKNRLKSEIILHQQSIQGKNNDYSKIS